MNMKVGGPSPFVSSVLGRKPASPETFTAESWRAGDPFECDGPGKVSRAACDLAGDVAGHDFADMIRQAAKPFL
jgi:hypothetical protein